MLAKKFEDEAKGKNYLTQPEHFAHDLFEAETPPGTRGAGPNRQAESANTRLAFDSSSPPARKADTVSRAATVEHLSLLPRQGSEAIRSVTETQARLLLALALVDPICRSRRGVIVGLRVRLGVSVAAINAALRQGAGNRLPIAEDNRTVRKVMAATFEFVRTKAWDDGRK